METKLTGGGGGAVERGRAAFLESWKWGMRRGDGSPTLVGKHMNLLVKAFTSETYIKRIRATDRAIAPTASRSETRMMARPASTARRAAARVSATVSFASEAAHTALEFEQMGKDDSPELKKKEEKADRREKYEATKRERARKLSSRGTGDW